MCVAEVCVCVCVDRQFKAYDSSENGFSWTLVELPRLTVSSKVCGSLRVYVGCLLECP